MPGPAWNNNVDFEYHQRCSQLSGHDLYEYKRSQLSGIDKFDFDNGHKGISLRDQYELYGGPIFNQPKDNVSVTSTNTAVTNNQHLQNIASSAEELSGKIQKASNSDEIVNACNELQDSNIGEVVGKLNSEQQQLVVSAYVNQLEDVKETLGLDKADSVSVITADGLVSASSFVGSSNILNAQSFLADNGIINFDEYGVNNWTEFADKVQNNSVFADEVMGVITLWIKDNFEYVADHEEEWNSFNSMVDMFNDNKIIEGDCEDVANFALNLFYGAGFSNSQVQAYGIAGNAETPGHIVLGYSSGTEAKRIIDFTQEFWGMDGLELLNPQEYDFSYNSKSTAAMQADSQYVFASSETDYGLYVAGSLGSSIYSIIDIISVLGVNEVKENYNIEGSFFEKIANRVEEILSENNGNLSKEAKDSLAIKILTEYCAESALSIGGDLSLIGVVFGAIGGSISRGTGIIDSSELEDKVSNIFTGAMVAGKIGAGLVAGKGLSGIASQFLPASASLSGVSSFLAGGIFGGLASLVVGKVAAGLMEDKPAVTFGTSLKSHYSATTTITGTDSETYDIDSIPEAFHNAKAWAYGAQSTNFNYRIGVKETDDDPGIQQQVFQYFDQLFSLIEEEFGTDMNEVLAKHEYFGTGADLRKSDGMNVMTDDIFNQLYGTILIDVLSDGDVIKGKFNDITGYRATTLWDELYPDEESRYLGKGEYRQKPSGKDAFNNKLVDPLNVPVYEELEIDVSKYSDVFDIDFFSAIIPDGGNKWDALFRFGKVVQATPNFLQQFNNIKEGNGCSSVQAYLSIENNLTSS